jgi:peptide/nickel transport system permease protein
MLVLLVILSMISFIVIQLPPGDFLTSYIVELQQSGQPADQAEVAALRARYGLDKPITVRYFLWIWGVLQGDFGMSFEWHRPVGELIATRLPLTIGISLTTTLLAYIIAIPIGIYSATHQYSAGDYAFTVMGFAGLAIPNFLLALIVMYILFKYFGANIGGLFSPEYQRAAWSFGKFIDMLKHLPPVIVIVGMSSTAWLIRVMRGTLLDELRKPYVIAARAKGVAESKLLLKYPVRVAINPIISTIGWTLPQIVSGATVTAIVLDLPTTGPMYLQALKSQDMYLAGSFTMFLTSLTIIGTFISDILLAMLDPRIRFEERA